MRKGRPSKTTVTFGLTIEMPPGMNIPDMRTWIKDAFKKHQKDQDDERMDDVDLEQVKLGLQNKEIKYNA